MPWSGFGCPESSHSHMSLLERDLSAPGLRMMSVASSLGEAGSMVQGLHTTRQAARAGSLHPMARLRQRWSRRHWLSRSCAHMTSRLSACTAPAPLWATPLKWAPSAKAWLLGLARPAGWSWVSPQWPSRDPLLPSCKPRSDALPLHGGTTLQSREDVTACQSERVHLHIAEGLATVHAFPGI